MVQVVKVADDVVQVVVLVKVEVMVVLLLMMVKVENEIEEALKRKRSFSLLVLDSVALAEITAKTNKQTISKRISNFWE